MSVNGKSPNPGKEPSSILAYVVASVFAGAGLVGAGYFAWQILATSVEYKFFYFIAALFAGVVGFGLARLFYVLLK